MHAYMYCERTVGLEVCSFADVGPQPSRLTSDDKFRESVVCAGRAGDSEEGNEEGLHFVWPGSSALVMMGTISVVGEDPSPPSLYIPDPHDQISKLLHPSLSHVTALCAPYKSVWYFIMRIKHTRWRGLPADKRTI